jgi:hypothetical protein
VLGLLCTSCRINKTREFCTKGIYFRPGLLPVLSRTRNLETYLIFCILSVPLNILHLCTDTVKEVQFASSKLAYIIDTNNNSGLDVPQRVDLCQGREGMFKPPMWRLWIYVCSLQAAWLCFALFISFFSEPCWYIQSVPGGLCQTSGECSLC